MPEVMDVASASSCSTAEAGAAVPFGGFDPALFEGLGAAERASFWFRSRNKLIGWAIDSYAGTPRDVLEVGCGTGYVLQAIQRDKPTTRLVGIEMFEEGLAIARSRLPTVDLRQGDVLNLKFDAEFDVVGAFDVLEHIHDDRRALDRIAVSLRPGGFLIATVPQHPKLWSQQDDVARHVRRYTAKDLHQKVEAAGFRIVRSTSFVTFLLPALFAGRRRGVVGLALPTVLDLALEAVMSVERLLIRVGVSLPIGGSLLVVASRNPESEFQGETDG